VALREEVAKAFDREFRTKRKREKIKFKEFAELYIENYAKVNKKSWRGDLYRIEANMIPFFGTLELQEIDPLLIEKYRAERLKADVTKSTVNREITIMKKMFNLAIDWSFTEENPVQKVKLFSEKDRQKERIITEEEEKNLLEACPGYVRPIIDTALNTGMRRGEIFNLEWKQVDLKERTIRVVYTKSGKDRIIPVNDRMNQVLLGQKQLNGKSPFVFPNPDTGRPYTDIKKSFKCACGNAGIKDLRFHDLRHTFASRLVRAGVDLITVRDLLGHFSVRVTQRYTHTGKDQKQRAVDLLTAKSQKRPQNRGNLLHNCYIN
jgi:integrase